MVTINVPVVGAVADNDNVYGPAPEPDSEAIDHVALVPDTDTSEVPKPVTDSENVIEYDNDDTFVGDVTEGVMAETTGATI